VPPVDTDMDVEFEHWGFAPEYQMRRCPFGRDSLVLPGGFRLGTASRTGFVPVRLRFGGHCTVILLISGIVERSFSNDDSGEYGCPGFAKGVRFQGSESVLASASGVKPNSARRLARIEYCTKSPPPTIRPISCLKSGATCACVNRLSSSQRR
jgi:hypothetical protein